MSDHIESTIKMLLSVYSEWVEKVISHSFSDRSAVNLEMDQTLAGYKKHYAPIVHDIFFSLSWDDQLRVCIESPKLRALVDSMLTDEQRSVLALTK